MTTIYLAGQIANTTPEEAKKVFALEEERIKRFGWEAFYSSCIDRDKQPIYIINAEREPVPQGTTENKKWEVMMRRALVNLSKADIVVFSYGWENSKGSLIELYLAFMLNIPSFHWDQDEQVYVYVTFPRDGLRPFIQKAFINYYD